MKTVILIAQGVAIRNFVASSFLDELLKVSDVAIVHNLPVESLQEYVQRYDQRVTWHAMPNYSEGPVRYILRRVLQWGHMRVCNTRAMRVMLKRARPDGWSPRAMANRAAWSLSKLVTNHHRLYTVARAHSYSVARSRYTDSWHDLWQKLQPDIVFNTDQRSLVVVPGVISAQHLKIPVATFIFSWDNLSSKARMPTTFDHYFVWSDLMCNELRQFYPQISRNQITITGTPQFEAYFDPDLLWDRETFCRKVGANPDRPIICYAGEDISTAPDGPQYLELLCNLVGTNAIEGQPNILARPSPTDSGERYNSVLERYPEIIWSPPQWKHHSSGSWEKATIKPTDTRLLANIIHHSALCINVCSTMTLDFALGGKPTVNIAFDISEPPPFGQPIWDELFQFEHYQPIIQLSATRVARSQEELARHINDYLHNPRLDTEARKEMIAMEIGVPPFTSAKRIVDALQNVAKIWNSR